ncbi:MAG: VWA domain-containing protein [Betaproteobacteria bacterium]|nr:VWA domain-containing protein [Betaproteobacteria bacterium]NBZ98796.1 VWA domain-containing protein [Betaproteobacteria bacterium]NDB43264.1 VWA domain-containing protein [Betaproteobacteria bacterium]NDD02029.1 VWA domain-containing protein [Betaproteobacteria bacterium]NDE25025.1 VWA domain-containing protein [Betaproteobacteria bacterium]
MPDLSSLQFLWPFMLYACVGVPLFAGHYAYQTKQVPPLVLCLGLLMLCAAMARPQTVLMSPLREATVMLVIDTSGSMRAKDLKPSRIEAAQQAAQQFIQDKPSRLRVGLVTVAGTAALAQAPTEERDALLKALDYLPLQYGSALGTGLLVSLEALLPGADIDAQKIINEASEMGGKKANDMGKSLDDKAKPATEASASRGKNMAIVLMSDGQSNMGPELLKMAELAAKHEVKVYTVGIGTKEGDVVHIQGRSMRVKLEDEALQKVSALTQGEYFRADSTEGLKNVYDQLGYKLRFEKRAMTEISAQIALLGMLLILISLVRNFARMGKII